MGSGKGFIMTLTCIEFYGGPVDGAVVDFEEKPAHKIKVSLMERFKQYPEAEYTLIFKDNRPYYVYDLVLIKEWLK